MIELITGIWIIGIIFIVIFAFFENENLMLKIRFDKKFWIETVAWPVILIRHLNKKI